jgi:hypothetical protein
MIHLNRLFIVITSTGGMVGEEDAKLADAEQA